MKKVVFSLLFFIAFFTTSALAQQETMGRKTAEQRTDIITKNLTEKLLLTPEQSAEAREIVLRREKLRDAGKLSKENQKEIHGDLKKILTKEQEKKWKELKEEKQKEKD